jgi:hypothetical protein
MKKLPTQITTLLDLLRERDDTALPSGLEKAIHEALDKAHTDGYRHGHHDTKYAMERFISDQLTIKRLQERDE